MWLPKNGRNVAIILASLVNTCDSIESLKRFHAFAIVTGLLRHSLVFAKIFRFAAVSPFGDLRYAHHLFDQIPDPRRAFFYNTLIRAHSKTSTPSHSLRLFNRMRLDRVDPDEFTLTFLLKSRARISAAARRNAPPPTIASAADDEIHGLALKLGFCSHLHVRNALIHLYGSRRHPAAAARVFSEIPDGEADVVSRSGLLEAYARAGEVELARQAFDGIPEKDRDVVSWTAMISCYSRAKLPKQALDLFLEMLDSGERPDEVAMVSVVAACRDSGDLETGLEAHRCAERAGFGWMSSLRNALIDMYAKCGSPERASEVFEASERKDRVTWNTMISAHSSRGDADAVAWLFRRMVASGVSPDGFTFLAVLVGLARKGSPEAAGEGRRVLESMRRDYGVEPWLEHYGCVADMLGKCGRVKEAYRLVVEMPVKSDGSVWESLAAACRRHGDSETEARAVKRLREFRPDGGYGLLIRDTCFSE